MRRVGAVFAVLASLVLGQVSAHQTVARGAPTDSDKLLPLTLRTRIPLPGVYGRMARSACDRRPVRHGANGGIQARQPSGSVSAGKGWAADFREPPRPGSIGVVDQKTGAVTKWKIPGHTNTRAMAFDEAGHRLFTAALQPGRFTVVDTESGAVVASLPCVLGVDDLWFDAARKRIYAPGSGAIDVFQQVDPDHYTAIAHVAVGAGAGSTSFHLKSRTQDSLFMSWPNTLSQG
jgi:hypothetical protein